MSRFIINGGKTIKGEIEVSGSKNAALPLVFAAILIDGESILENVPDISDVNIALNILEYLGAKIKREDNTVSINTAALEYRAPPPELVSQLRASSYLLGAMTARFKMAEIQNFGGCNFDIRPIDMHLDAIEAVGGVINGKKISAKSLHAADIYFKKASVGATINALLLTARAAGESRIYGYAKEPHAFALIDFLVSAGADIEIFPDFIRVRGRELKNAKSRVIPDMIEAGSYASLALLSGADLKISGANLDDLAAFFEFAIHGGAILKYGHDCFSLFGSIDRRMTVRTAPYPEFPTDLQPLCAPLLSRCGGEICETVWHRRFGYLSELSKFGINYKTEDSTAYIFPSVIHRGVGNALDLRGGMALVITAVSAYGESVINSAETVRRGYENIVYKLRNIGCDIEEIT